MPKPRQATHAGSWYDAHGETLAARIDNWLREAATGPPETHARAIISPHAGYAYCGHVMAHAYRQLDASQVARVFLLGPSHHVYTRKCLLSTATHYCTPLGDAEVDLDINRELEATGAFEYMDLDVDEAEHSLELQMAYLMRVMGGRTFKLIPIMVGALTVESEAHYGKLLAPYLDNAAHAFIISSDFCHWGTRFNYLFYERSRGAIHQSIEWLDKLGMEAIEQGSPDAFADYLRQYGNTICGRHPIGLFLSMLNVCQTRHAVKFKHYDQSSRCVSARDSSVSYAAAVVTVVPRSNHGVSAQKLGGSQHLP